MNRRQAFWKLCGPSLSIDFGRLNDHNRRTQGKVVTAAIEEAHVAIVVMAHAKSGAVGRERDMSGVQAASLDRIPQFLQGTRNWVYNPKGADQGRMVTPKGGKDVDEIVQRMLLDPFGDGTHESAFWNHFGEGINDRFYRLDDSNQVACDIVDFDHFQNVAGTAVQDRHDDC